MRRTNSSGFRDTNGSPNLGQKTRSYHNRQKKKKKKKKKRKRKRTCRIVDFAVPVDHRVKLKECEKKDKYLDLARELKNLWNMKMTIIPILIGALGTATKGLVQGQDDLEITCGDNPNNCIIEIGQNTEKSPGNLKRLVVTQNPVRNNQLTLVWKTLKREQIIKKKSTKKEILQNCGLCCLSGPQSKIEKKKQKEG